MLWALANVMDGALKKNLIADEVALSWLITAIRLPVVLAMLAYSLPFSAEPKAIGLMLLSGLLLTFPLTFYYKALAHEDPSRIALILQSVPVFNLLIAYFTLNESLTSMQAIAFSILILAGMIAALRHTIKGWRLSQAFGLILLASFLWAVSDVLFKAASPAFPHYLDGFTLYMLGSFLTSFLFLAETKGHILRAMLKAMSPKAWGYVITTSLGGFLGSAAFTFALTLGKVSLTSVLMGVQPLFVFGLGIGLHRFSRTIAPEDTSKKALLMKGLSFALVVAGLALLEM